MAAKSTKSRSGRPTPGGGRVTPKGGQVAAKHNRDNKSGDDKWESARYTPPSPKGPAASPPWWPVLIFGLLGIGMLIIILNYAGILPSSPNNWLLLPAIVCLTGGLFAAMGYR